MYLPNQLIAADQSINLPTEFAFGLGPIHKKSQNNERTYSFKFFWKSGLTHRTSAISCLFQGHCAAFSKGHSLGQNVVHISISGMVVAFQLFSFESSVCGQLPVCCCLLSVGKLSTFFVQKCHFT